jgi:hypothetical protein
MDRVVATAPRNNGGQRGTGALLSIVMRGLDPRIHPAAVVRSSPWIAGSSPRLSG